MYIPTPFAETDLARLHEFIEQHSFGLLVSSVGGRPFATHLPLLLDRESSPSGTLIGHMARANPQWSELDGQTGLAIFSGPHAYISPAWYEAENVVPTWNYVAVHAYGPVQLIQEPGAVFEIVEKTVAKYEQPRPQPWSLAGSDHTAQQLLTQIVGFRLPIDRIEGKWKLNQNHPVQRRQKVIGALQAEGDPHSVAIADLMAAALLNMPRSERC
jgi:transcriptional regulator